MGAHSLFSFHTTATLNVHFGGSFESQYEKGHFSPALRANPSSLSLPAKDFSVVKLNSFIAEKKKLFPVFGIPDVPQKQHGKTVK